MRKTGNERRAFCTIFALFALVPCSTLAADAHAFAERLESWLATAHHVGVEWQRGTLPLHYAARTLMTAEDKLARLHKDLADEPASAATAQLHLRLERGRLSIAALREAVESGRDETLTADIARVKAAARPRTDR
jgi:hypothetical protein